MVTVACAQIKIEESVEKNTSKIIEFLKKAAKKKVDIVCFPEAALVRPKNKTALKKIPSSNYLDKIKNACKENNIHCIFSTYALEKNKVYNRAYCIDNKGKILCKYDKRNLFRTEKNKITRGKENKAINTKFGKIGITICWDITNPNTLQSLAKKGATIIFCPSYIKNYGRELESYLSLPYARAFENSAYIISCDSANKDCANYSIICSPKEKLAESKKKEELIITKLDMRYIAGVRKYYSLV